MTPEQTQQARAYWASVGRPWPRVSTVVLLTLVLGAFGVFIAYNEATKAERWGAPSGVYYALWLLTWLIEVLVGLFLFVVWFHHHASSAVPGLGY